MKIFKSVANIVFLCVILLLTGALICSLLTIHSRNSRLSDLKAQLAANEDKISAASSQIADAQAQLAEQEKEKSETAAALEAAQNEKRRLEEENAALKKQLETLSAKKKAEKKKKETISAVSSPQRVTPDGRRVCYLTFDDGPSDNTLEILKILKRFGVKATFFVIDSDKFGYVKNIYDEGHTVALHSATHNYAQIYASIDAYFADLQKISDRVESTIGIRPTVIRFPGGSSNRVSREYCTGIMTKLVRLVGERGYSYFDWNVSSCDAESNTPSRTFIRNNVLNSAKNKNSACVLMHDTALKTTTVEALPEIIEGLTRMGYTFERLSPETYGYHHVNLNN